MDHPYLQLLMSFGLDCVLATEELLYYATEWKYTQNLIEPLYSNKIIASGDIQMNSVIWNSL